MARPVGCIGVGARLDHEALKAEVWSGYGERLKVGLSGPLACAEVVTGYGRRGHRTLHSTAAVHLPVMYAIRATVPSLLPSSAWFVWFVAWPK